MSFWSRLKARLGGGSEEDDGGGASLAEVAPSGGAPATPIEADARPAEEGGGSGDAEIVALSRVGLDGGPSAGEAISIVRRARGTIREADAVAAITKATSDRSIPDDVRVACADILAARGDEASASAILEGVASTSGLVLAADLYAASGQLPRAVSTIERVLGRELDAPGARERHQRWRAALGVSIPKAGRLDEATIVAANPEGGPFRLLREVARGGAGTVYEAEDEILGRRVAFKVYHDRSSAEGPWSREVRAAAALAGPGVVRVLDAAPSEGWIALEWIARGSLRDLIRAGDVGALSPIARWATPLARALSRVHAAGLVHADVKPGNVLLRQLNEPVLSDFGIARPRGAAGEGGSPGYVSPERLSGAAMDPRDDIYGFGRILEDALHILVTPRGGPLVEQPAPSASGAGDVAQWRSLADRCMGPLERRPVDGADLVRSLP